MIVLDTNVLSETMRIDPDRTVMDWLRSVPHRQRHITVITTAELHRGVMSLPMGRRRDDLQSGVEKVLGALHGTVLGVDERAAPHFADIVTERSRQGRPIGDMDAWIAAVCRRHDAPLATRNIKDFEGTGIALINPFDPK